MKKKKINIISLGQKENKFYPFRKKFDEVIKKNFQKKNYLIQSHPGYNYSKSKKIFKGDKYLKLLSKSKIMISDTTQLNIVMIKHIECLYNRCVMFCNSILKPNLYDLKNKINFVHVNEKNLSYKLKYYLDNPSKLNKISKNGYNLYKKKYSNKIYVKRMEDYFVKISKSHVFKYSKNYNFIIFFKLKTLSLYSELIRFLKKILFKLRLKKKYQL